MATWKLDKAHSEIKFKAKHLVVSTVTGYFNEFDGTVTTDRDDFSDAKIYFEADVRSINTANETRDTHLRTSDFFDA
jgi:polyisoprenoid-binding protein YceI